MVGHHLDDVGKAHQRLNRTVPGLRIGAGKVVVLHRICISREPAIGLHDLKRESAGGQDQRKQRVRVQRNRTEKILEVGDGVELIGRRGIARRRRRRWRLRSYRADAAGPDDNCRDRDPGCCPRLIAMLAHTRHLSIIGPLISAPARMSIVHSEIASLHRQKRGAGRIVPIGLRPTHTGPSAGPVRSDLAHRPSVARRGRPAAGHESAAPHDGRRAAGRTTQYRSALALW